MKRGEESWGRRGESQRMARPQKQSQTQGRVKAESIMREETCRTKQGIISHHLAEKHRKTTLRTCQLNAGRVRKRGQEKRREEKRNMPLLRALVSHTNVQVTVTPQHILTGASAHLYVCSDECHNFPPWADPNTTISTIPYDNRALRVASNRPIYSTAYLVCVHVCVYACVGVLNALVNFSIPFLTSIPLSFLFSCDDVLVRPS